MSERRPEQLLVAVKVEESDLPDWRLEEDVDPVLVSS